MPLLGGVSVFITASDSMQGFEIISEMQMTPLLELGIENFPKGYFYLFYFIFLVLLYNFKRNSM